MKKLIFIYIIIISIIFNGCIMYEEGYPEKITYIKLNENYSLSLRKGSAQEIYTYDSCNVFKVDLFSVIGGSTKLFGKIKINKGGDGYKAKRIHILKGLAEVKSYSYYDILDLKSEMIDTIQVYIVPDNFE